MVSNSIVATGAILLPNIAGYVTSIPVRKNMAWYASLKKPQCGPPDWIFAPAWTVVYSALGYSSYLVWKHGGGCTGAARIPLMVYGGHLLLNFSWAPIFFSLHKLKYSLYGLYAIDVTSLITAYLFYQVKPATLWFFLPYFVGLSYATAQTYSIVKQNPEEGATITEIKDE